MNKLLVGLAIFANMAFLPGRTDPIVKGWKTYDSMGCMMLRECTDNVREVKKVEDLGQIYSQLSFKDELKSIFVSMKKLDIKAYIADDKYFFMKTRGLYSVDTNSIFINERYTSNPLRTLKIIRHEVWHAVQDCMGGSLDNTFTAIVFPPKKIPDWISEGAKKTYPKSAALFEAEAMNSMYSPNITRDAIAVCASDKPMWEVYPPTPLTKKWLKENNYITK